MLASIVSRVKGILLSPKEEWATIAGEPANVGAIYTGYIIPLSAVAALASFLGLLIFGVSGMSLSFGFLLGQLILSFVIGLIMVYVFALIVNQLAPFFGASQDLGQAFKLAAYVPTASRVAQFFSIIPALGLLGLVGAVYSLYLLFVGLPIMMRPPQERATVYTLACVGCAVVLMIVLVFVARSFT